jgi:tetratricopeptide (TPR) repeat protein
MFLRQFSICRILPIAFVLWLSAASDCKAQISAREESVTIPTWAIGPAEVHSLFYDAGPDEHATNIYPYTAKDVLTDHRVDQTYKAVILENEYIKILVLPEIGGRLHGALDKTNNYVWIYWQKTIKPGLIGLTGAWISGGIEWNFPHFGHRPTGFSPVDHRLIHNPDGSATVWVGETELIYGMRWLVGMTIFPGRSYIRCDYILVNSTDHRYPLYFWATAATHANEWAQAQFPASVVTGHGKHEFWNWPIDHGVDLSWWKNIPNASSFFDVDSQSDWTGTYDHKAQAGLVHVADHHIMAGKKLWTWGAGPSGRIWEDILSDGGGPYFEPQAGAWSDNQPDFHWMQPYEVQTTHDYWYPVRDTRGYHNANADFAVNTDLRDGKAFGGVYATSIMADCRVVLEDARTGTPLADRTVTIAPDRPATIEVPAPAGLSVYDLRLAVYDAKGALAIDVRQQPPKKVPLPAGQKDPGDPRQMTPDELYRAGEWLERFTRIPEAVTYYEEALKRDAGDSRANAAMGFLAVKEGRWNDALGYFDRALIRDGDNSGLYYGKGLAFHALGRVAEARDAFFRATYTSDYFSPAYLNLARLDMARGDYRDAIANADMAATRNAKFADIPALQAAAYRHLGDFRSALANAERALNLDPMHPMGGFEKVLALNALADAGGATWQQSWRDIMRGDAENYLELATAYGADGLYAEACDILTRFADRRQDTDLHPMVNYLRGYYNEHAGGAAAAADFYARAARGPLAYANPHRLVEQAALEAALRRNPSDSHAHLLLGNLLYSKRRREEALAHWRKASEIDSKLAYAWRNLGYAERFYKKDLRASYAAYKVALALAPEDARVLLEQDQVAEQLAIPSSTRLAVLNGHLETASGRDGLSARLVDLWLERGDEPGLRMALDLLRRHHFHSWEGGYGIHDAWAEVNQRLGDLALTRKDFPAALELYRGAFQYPGNLEVAPRTPDFLAPLYWNLARVYRATGDRAHEREALENILAERYETPHIGLYYRALALKASGDENGYRAALAQLEHRARKLTSGAYEFRGTPETIGHFLLSLALEEKGDRTAAGAERQKALQLDPQAARLAIREAQLAYASAHQ